MWPTLVALYQLGGTARNAELFYKIVEDESFSEAQVVYTYGKSPSPQLPWAAAFARTNLKKIGLIDNTQRGVWVLTALGEKIVRSGEKALWHLDKSSNVNQPNSEGAISTQRLLLENNINTEVFSSWQNQVLEELYKLNPYDFEKLCQRLLREAGFREVRVTQKSGDGGMDGYGTLAMNLVSFKVAFQAKRYKGSVGAPEVQKVRGALNSRTERAEKGLIITTGSFTHQAREEAAELPSIDLIDGEDLCLLLKQYKMGVVTKMVEEVQVQPEFFANLS